MNKIYDILAIVVLYNFDNQVIDNINFYSKYCKEVLAIDNSEKKNQDLIDKLNRIQNLKYISLNDNYGIAKALNIGCEYAINKNYLWALTMDQDSVFDENMLHEFYKVIETTKCDDVILISPNYFFDRKLNRKYDGIKEKDYVMQSGNLLNLKNYIKLGKYKENFFIDGVDYEYCLRAKKQGYRVIECGNAILNHQPGITKKFLFFKYGYCSPLRIYYQIRNLLWINANYKNLKIKIIVVYKFLKIVFLFDNKKAYLKMFFKAIKDFNNNLYGKIED